MQGHIWTHRMSDHLTQSTRRSGRVGDDPKWTEAGPRVPALTPISSDFIAIYRRLQVLLASEDCELMKAIAYGLSLFQAGNHTGFGLRRFWRRDARTSR